MAHFAQINENNIVVQVVVASEDFIRSGALGDPTKWKQTSYNTYGNQHPEGRPLRGNYAGIGDTYDEFYDVFYAPQPYPSWTLDRETWLWNAPTPHPNDGKFYNWNEKTLSWQEINLTQEDN